MLWLLLVFVCLLVLLVLWVQLGIRSVQPAVYPLSTVAEAEPYLRSWGQWLEERGKIVVQHTGSGAEVEFRKHRYKTRPDVLVFRYRNADATRASFAEVQSCFDSDGVEYHMEHTKKQRRPRALAVALDPADVFTPVAAVRLLSLALGADAEVRVFCQGRIRGASDRPAVALIPPTRGQKAGFRIGRSIGRALIRLRG